MKKLILSFICVFTIFFANAVNLYYRNSSGKWNSFNIPTNYLGHTYLTISSNEIGLPNCESGDIVIQFVLDSQEQDEDISLESFTYDSNWSSLASEQDLPSGLNYVMIQGHANSCASMTLDINNLGAHEYKYYEDFTTGQCLLATTRSDAVCKKGCTRCIAQA